MSIRVKNEPPTYQKVVNRGLKEYLNKFMNIFGDDFIVYNDIYIHLDKFNFFFQKCREFGINMNLD
jgi:hypothetical protein